jgi:DNA mismatch repair protein MutL
VSDTIQPKQLREDPAEYKTTAAIEPSAASAARPPEAPVTETLQKSASPAPEQLSLITPDDTASIPKPVLVGQVFDTYWIIQFEDKMFIMDQHAAHEKILYERTMHRLESGSIDTQIIAPPVILSLNMREKEVLSQNIDIFTRLGFEIESFGGNEYKVTGMPATLPSLDDRELLMDIIDSLMEEGGASSKPELITQRVASMSCKAAVKGNMRMSFAEAQNLVEELMNADNPYNCPHGRPTLISMSKYELEKKFKRIV